MEANVYDCKLNILSVLSNIKQVVTTHLRCTESFNDYSLKLEVKRHSVVKGSCGVNYKHLPPSVFRPNKFLKLKITMQFINFECNSVVYD